MKMRFTKVEKSIPPKTVVPRDLRADAPAPVASISGTTPKRKAKDVIRMGRRRVSAALMADSTTPWPWARSCSPNSTMRMAFFDARPTSITSPTWQKTSFTRPRAPWSSSAPIIATGTASMTTKGRAKLSYCAASTRKTNTMPSAKMTSTVLPALFCSRDRPVHS
ncbi:hypothetical protein COSO111634_35820 [Corallococcus soli]